MKTILPVLLGSLLLPAILAAQPVAVLDDAAISHDPATLTWTLENASVAFTLGIDRGSGALQAMRLVNVQTGRDWIVEPANDTTVVFAVGSSALGPGDGFQYEGFEVDEWYGGLELRLSFAFPDREVRAVRHYVVYPGAPGIEVWTSFVRLVGGTTELLELNVWQLNVGPGDLIYVTGQEPEPGAGEPFSRRRVHLASGQRLLLGSTRRSSLRVIPWLAIEDAGEQFFGGIMWSGSWSLAVEEAESALRMSVGLPSMAAWVTNNPVETPHGFFGVASNRAQRLPLAMRVFTDVAVRHGRPLEPLITFNTWFVHGATTDEVRMREEIDRAARLGVELFVLDAGWYEGAGAEDMYDYTSGLGTWRVDPYRFPSGLRALAEYAHSRGVKFGLWVEPERVALGTVDAEGLALQEWLATEGGLYDPSFPDNDSVQSAQVCLGDPEARQWVLERLCALLDEVQPDYLKWDDNLWVNCDREGHDHPTTGGNFAHVSGLYEILSALRERYPGMLIENCSGGGRRLDFGMLRLTDVAWMDDQTASSRRVRHNLEGLGQVFPPTYLFSFVLGDQPTGDWPDSEEDWSEVVRDLPLMFRSRMPGVLGLGDGGLAELEPNTTAREFEVYRRLREIQRSAASFLLTDQALAAELPGWDAIEQLSWRSGDAIVFAFQNDPEVDTVQVWPIGLNPDARYEVTSIDYGLVGEAWGSDLMENGIEIVAAPLSAAHVLILRVLPDVARPEAASDSPTRSR